MTFTHLTIDHGVCVGSIVVVWDVSTRQVQCIFAINVMYGTLETCTAVKERLVRGEISVAKIPLRSTNCTNTLV